MTVAEAPTLEKVSKERKELGRQIKAISQVLAVTDRVSPVKKEVPISHELLKDNPFKTRQYSVLLQERDLLAAQAAQVTAAYTALTVAANTVKPTGYENLSVEELNKLESEITTLFYKTQEDFARIRREISRRRVLERAKDKLKNMSPEERAAITHVINANSINSKEQVDAPGT